MILLATLTSLNALSQKVLESKKICLEPVEMDYFLKQDVRADHLAIDSIELSKKVAIKDSLILLLKYDKADLRQALKNEAKIAAEYKNTAIRLNIDNTEVKTTNARRKKVIIWTIACNLAKDVLIGGYIYLKH